MMCMYVCVYIYIRRIRRYTPKGVYIYMCIYIYISNIHINFTREGITNL